MQNIKLDPERAARALEEILIFFEKVVEDIRKVWGAIKEWLKANPVIAELLEKEIATKGNARDLFKPVTTQAIFRHQVMDRKPMRAVARSQC